jgi:hypothetical protein
MGLRGEANQVFTPEECETLISFTNELSFYEWNLDLSKATTRDTIRISNPIINSKIKNEILKVRRKIHSIVQKYIHEPIYIEYSNYSFRPSGTAHPMHVDNRVYDQYTKKTSIRAGTNPSTRDYSAILYLNKCEGGEFCFHNNDTHEEDVVHSIEPGKLVFFSSGVENLHSSRITHSDRWTFVLFFTLNKNAEEKY